MIKLLIKITVLIFLLSGLTSCLDPNYYIWRYQKPESPNLPWSGVDKTPKRQYTRYIAPMSGTGYGMDIRWRISFFNKLKAHEIADEAGKYLIKNDILHRWGFKYYTYGNGFFGSNPPYELKIVSVTPTIITMRPYLNKDIAQDDYNLRHPKNTSYMKSDYFYKPVHYGKLLNSYQDNLLYFSPDLDILPQPLNLKKNGKRVIYWNRLFSKGAIEFLEKDGVVQTRRLDNKEGKDTKKDEGYDPDYHLTLIEREERTEKKWEEYRDKASNDLFERNRKLGAGKKNKIY